MKNNLKNQLERMSMLMEYKYSVNKSYLLKEGDNEEEKEKLPFRMNRVGGGIRVQNSETGDHIDIPYELLDEFFQKLSTFKKV